MDFKETQRIDVTWLRWLFIISGAAIVLMLVYAVISGQEDVEGAGLYVGILIVLFSMGGTYWLVFKTELETTIDSAGFQYRYPPFLNRTKTIAWSEIESWELIRLTDRIGFVGYGYGYKKQTFRKITSFLMGGNEAVRLILTNGHTFIFNTRMTMELQHALAKHIANKQKVQ